MLDIDKGLLNVGQELLSGTIRDIPRNNLKYLLLYEVKIHNICGMHNTLSELESLLRDYIEKSCGAIWAFRLAMSLRPVNTEGIELYQPHYVMEHAKIIYKTFGNFIKMVRVGVAKHVGDYLYSLVVESDETLIERKNQYKDLYRAEDNILENYIKSTSPIYCIDDFEQQIYSSMSHYTDYIIGNNAVEQRHHYRNEAFNYIANLYDLKTDGLDELERLQFVIGLVSLGVFPNAEQQKRDWEEHWSASNKEWFKGTDSYKYFQSRIKTLYNYLENEKFQQLRYIATLSISADSVSIDNDKLKYQIKTLMLLSYTLNSCIKGNLGWSELREREHNGKNHITGFRLSLLEQLEYISCNKNIISFFIKCGCNTLDDVIEQIYSGGFKQVLESTTYPSYTDIVNTLSYLGVSEMLKTNHINTREENIEKSKYAILGYDESWLINNATLEDEPFKSQLADNSKETLKMITGSADVKHIILAYNSGVYGAVWCKAIENFVEIITKIGYGRLLKYNYSLRFMNDRDEW